MLLTRHQNDVVYGALYEMKASEKPLLDRCEGEGYMCDTLSVRFQEKTYESFVYIAENSHIDENLKPHSWYREIVLLGALYHQLPEVYLRRIRDVDVGADSDHAQQARNNQLILEMRDYTSKA